MNTSAETSSVSSFDPVNRFSRFRYNTTIAFTAGLLLFLLPFAELKCGSVALAGNTGIGLVLGKPWKIAMVGDSQDLVKQLNESAKDGKKHTLKEEPNIFAIAALVAGLAGLAFSLLSFKLRAASMVAAGALGVLMLVGLLVQFKLTLRSSLPGKNSATGLNMEGLVKIEFTVWYYLCIVLFALAGLLGYRQHSRELAEAIEKNVDFEFQRQTPPSASI
jgi:hypothetical protein